jgi:uncharacterized protein with WD repeat/tetratricopeptide (TPR) repeat protein
MNGDIELELSAAEEPGIFTVKVLRSAAGGCPVSRLVLDAEGILARHDQLESAVLASAVQRRRVLPSVEQLLQEVGRQLFEAVFTGAVAGAYRASLGAVQQAGKRLRVGLHVSAPELAALPWEAMFDPETGTYVCRTEPLIRHVDAPYTPQPLDVHPPLHILGLIASPKGLPMLNVEAEQQRLEQALAKPLAAGQVELTWVPDASWETIHDLMLDGTWHILHFVGHGDFDLGSDEGVLALAGSDGRVDLVEASRITDLLSEADPTPQLVVLNSCSSGQGGVHDLFSGTAAALVHGGISAAAAMQFSISDTAAVSFARGFYTAIARGRAIDEAVRSGRIAILGAPHTLEWVTPVLYVRGGITQLFKLTASPTPRLAALGLGQVDRIEAEALSSEQPPQPPSRPSQTALHAMYIRARGELHVQHYDTAVQLLSELLTLDPDHWEAADLLERAQRGLQLADAYARGRTAEDAGDWATAITEYDTILQADSSYQDTGERRERCHKRQQVADRQSELRYHYNAGNWQAVLDLDAELTDLDPAITDPDGLTTKAREELRQADLDNSYQQGRASEAAQNWTAAAATYAEIVNMDSAYRDAAARLDDCTKRVKADELMARLRQHLEAKDWQNLQAAMTELTGHDPTIVDTELIDRVRRDLAIHLTQPVMRIRFGHSAYSVEWCPCKDEIAAAGFMGWVCVYNSTTGRERLKFKAAPLLYSVSSVAFSPDGTRLATGGSNSLARIWDAATGAKLLEIQHLAWVQEVAFSPDGTRLATGCDDKMAQIWDAATGAEISRLNHHSDVKTVAFSPDGTRLATGGSNSLARIWDAATGAKLLEFQHDSLVWAVAFSPDGTRLATGSRDKLARIWDAATGAKLLEIQHEAWVRTVAFSPDGTRLATGSGDKMAQIWDAATGAKLLEIQHDSLVWAVAFSPDGTRLATGSEGKLVQIWPVPRID